MPPDSWIWAVEPKEKYSVKSCYRMLLGEYTDSRPWTKLWKLQQQVESAYHLFAGCCEVKRLWDNVGLSISYIGNDDLSQWFFRNISIMAAKLSSTPAALFSLVTLTLGLAEEEDMWEFTDDDKDEEYNYMIKLQSKNATNN
nr:uncharacterized protein LOC109170919 [Ipomoea batatas]